MPIIGHPLTHINSNTWILRYTYVFRPRTRMPIIGHPWTHTNLHMDGFQVGLNL